MDKEYYASADTSTAAKKIYQIIKSQTIRMASETGISNIWNRNLQIYYKNALCDVLDFVGEQGELVSMSVPQARSLARQTVAITCKQKLNFKAISRSSDYTSMANSQIAEALANQIVDKQKLDNKKDQIAEQAYVLGQTFWHVQWDSEAGTTTKSDNVKPIKSGDVKITTCLPQYVFYDWNSNNWDELVWGAVAERMNRWDLIAQHPELETEILQLPAFSRKEQSFSTTNKFAGSSDDELVLVYYYYHKPTPAVPFGRMMIFANESTIFYDGPNVYETIPIIAVMPEKLPDYLLGYPQFSNLAPAQEMLDHNFSVVASNQSAFGVQTILNPRGSNIDITEVGGMKWVDFTPQSVDGGGRPEPLQLTKTAPELIDMINIYKNNMSELANINGALRGTPPAGITAGNALATLTANSIEFLTSFSLAIYNSVEEVLTLSVKMFHMFGADTQMISLADGNTSYVKEFKASDLSNFDKIKLDVTSPAMATYSGRLNDAELLLSRGLISDIGTYFQVKEGAPVKVTYEVALDEANLIRKENDDLMQGVDCPVLFTDKHPMHILHHTSLLNNPETRRNGQAVQIILNHIQQHQQLEMQQAQPNPSAVGNQPQAVGQQAPQQMPSPSNQQSVPAAPAKPGASF